MKILCAIAAGFCLCATIAAIVLFFAAIAYTQAPGSAISVPITIDYVTLSQALERQIYTDNGRAIMWQGSNTCQYFYAEHPVFSSRNGALELQTNGRLSIGVPMGSQCLAPIQWEGIVDAEASPWISGHMLKIRITDLNLLNAQHEKTLIAGKGFDLIKQYFIPRIETFEFDLSPATQQLDYLAEAAGPPEVADRVKATLATLRIAPEIATLGDGIRAAVQLTLPSFPTASPAAVSPQLTPAELAAFEKELDQWDAFLVFAVKQLGASNIDKQFRSDLLAVLLDSRYRLVDALAHPQSAGPDPVRILFLDTWNRLAQIIRTAAHRNALGGRSLEFLSFISAGDALLAFDQAAPALGMRISADDLRRLAHIMAPMAKGDPLAFSFAEDPELRKMFGVKEPLESEGPFVPGPTEIATPTGGAPTPSPSPTSAPSSSPIPGTPAAARSPALAPESSPAPATPLPETPAPTPARSSRIDSGRWDFGAAEAFAADLPRRRESNPKLTLQELGRKLKRAVAGTENAPQYRAEMAQLIELVGMREMEDEGINPRYRNVYTRMVKAVAWQESCWRQFRLRGNKVVYLESSSHDVGLMQVNKFVWRGFYSIPRLEWDVIYNASAGMEILADLLDRVSAKPGAMTPGDPDQLARSAYAAYNGGPGSYRRWRGRESREARMIDRLFWQKFQAVSHGQQIDVLSCAAEWEKTPGH